MSSVALIAIIVSLLACLVCYAFIVQAMQQRRQQRQRLLAALHAKARNFQYMLNGFPAGFLPRELTVLTQRSLVEILEQLIRLEPRNAQHKQDLRAVSQQLKETRQHSKTSHPQTLENPQQIQEIKKHLEELYRFIHQQQSKQRITPQEADVYRAQVRELVLSLTVDSYAIYGQQARQLDKNRLALHYFTLAHKLLMREDTTGHFQQRAEQLQGWIDQAKGLLVEQTPDTRLSDQESAEQEEIEKEWERFTEEEESWKKKNLYD